MSGIKCVVCDYCSHDTRHFTLVEGAGLRPVCDSEDCKSILRTKVSMAQKAVKQIEKARLAGIFDDELKRLLKL